MGKRVFDHVGERFGMLTALKHAGGGNWSCECTCGRVVSISGNKLRTGHTKSCGCATADLVRASRTTHGRYHEVEFQTWKNMIGRCGANPWYQHVQVCDRWLASYEAFLADVGRRPSEDHSIDRIDPEGHYEPSNVRWATRVVQSQNTRNHVTNKTGIRGVSWSRAKNKWRAHISVGNRSVHIGYFRELKDAAAARALAESKLWSTS